MPPRLPEDCPLGCRKAAPYVHDTFVFEVLVMNTKSRPSRPAAEQKEEPKEDITMQVLYAIRDIRKDIARLADVIAEIRKDVTATKNKVELLEARSRRGKTPKRRTTDASDTGSVVPSLA